MYKDFTGRKWYKGNLHSHTILSDGVLTPETLEIVYRNNGYDFLSITDHWIVREDTTEEKDFIILSGCEYAAYPQSEFNGIPRTLLYHITGIGFQKTPDLTGTANVDEHEPPQKIIDEIHKAGGLAFLAHPAWSSNTINDVWALNDLDGMEVYNSFAGFGTDYKGDSGYLSDDLAGMRRFLPLIAVDDTHENRGEVGGGFIMVQAVEFTRSGIITAIKEGRFFASQGPMLETKLCDGKVLLVKCDPCKEILIHTGSWDTRRRYSGDGISSCCYILPENIRFYRVEVVNMDGKRAWTSPVRVCIK